MKNKNITEARKITAPLFIEDNLNTGWIHEYTQNVILNAWIYGIIIQIMIGDYSAMKTHISPIHIYF